MGGLNRADLLKRFRAATRRTLAAFDLPPARLGRSYAKGKWTAREILAHLADCELLFLTRLKFVLSERRPVIVPCDQDLWADRGAYRKADLRLARRTFGVLREQFVRLVATMTPADFRRRGRHPESPDYTAEYLVVHGLEHNEHHLKQLVTIQKSTKS